jgi:hypothetical protein
VIEMMVVGVVVWRWWEVASDGDAMDVQAFL